MNENKSLGINLISGFYILGGLVLLYTALFTNIEAEKFGIAIRLGIPWIPEFYARVGMALLAFTMVYGLLKFSKWGFWLFVSYNIYFFAVSSSLFMDTGNQLFSGNLVWSITMLVYMLYIRKKFIA